MIELNPDHQMVADVGKIIAGQPASEFQPCVSQRTRRLNNFLMRAADFLLGERTVMPPQGGMESDRLAIEGDWLRVEDDFGEAMK